MNADIDARTEPLCLRLAGGNIVAVDKNCIAKNRLIGQDEQPPSITAVCEGAFVMTPIVHQGSVIWKFSSVESNAALMGKVTVGNGTIVTGSTVLGGSSFGDWCTIDRCFIGEGTEIGDNTTIRGVSVSCRTVPDCVSVKGTELVGDGKVDASEGVKTVVTIIASLNAPLSSSEKRPFVSAVLTKSEQHGVSVSVSTYGYCDIGDDAGSRSDGIVSPAVGSTAEVRIDGQKFDDIVAGIMKCEGIGKKAAEMLAEWAVESASPTDDIFDIVDGQR